MYYFIVTLHMVVCIGLILIVLLQTGKGAGLANLLGGGGGDQLFSAPSGSAFLKKVTTVIAIVFLLTSVFLTMLSSRHAQRSLMERVPLPPAPTQPPIP